MILTSCLIIGFFLFASPAWAKGGSSSDTQSSTSTTTTSQDNRVAADSNGVALGAGAALNYTNNNNFSDNVLTAVQELVGLVRDAGQQAVDFSQKAISASEAATSAVAQNASDTSKAVTSTLNAQTQGSATVIAQIAPFVVVAVLGVFLIVYYFGKGK